MKRIVCFGPGPIFKGGVANYNTALAKALDRISDTEVYIVSWIQQYPALIPSEFLDKKSKENLLSGTNIKVHYITNYNNPFTWYRTFTLIHRLNPDMIIFQWAVPLQGLPLSYIASKIKKYTNIEVIFDLHFIRQKERNILDRSFTKIGLKNAHTYITHTPQTAKELKRLFPSKRFEQVQTGRSPRRERTTILDLFHPVNEIFQPHTDFDREALKEKLNLRKHVFLFFGFIRRYKGVHNAIRAFANLAKERDDVSLLIVGESFWQTLQQRKISTFFKRMFFLITQNLLLKKQTDEQNYRPLRLIRKFKIKDYVTVINKYVPNEDIYKYFQVSDAILMFYLSATPAGVESIAHAFRLPVLATRVGHFPEIIKDGYNGYLAEPNNVKSMTQAMRKALHSPISPEHITETTKHMSWDTYARAILGT